MAPQARHVSTLRERIKRLSPYFATSRGTWGIVVIATIVGAFTEPMIPALMKPLLEQGFQKGQLEIWKVPAALLALFAVRGFAGYIAQVGLTKITGTGLVLLRKQMFQKVLCARLDLFSLQSSSAISNTLVYEVQSGAAMLINSILSLTRNVLVLLALVAFLFGLVHGLGFAGALKEIGLPENHLALALLTFNVGVEIGQLLTLTVAYLLTKSLARKRWFLAGRKPALYFIGTIAMYWSWLRIAALIT